jgi:hypothetical protein
VALHRLLVLRSLTHVFCLRAYIHQFAAFSGSQFIMLNELAASNSYTRDMVLIGAQKITYVLSSGPIRITV